MNIAARRHRRWGDNDRHFGPFTFSRDKRYRPFAAVLSSGEEENEGCHLRVSAFGNTLIAELPALINPHREKIEAKSWDATTIERLGRDWYWNEYRKDYGFSVSEGFLQVFLGRQTYDSTTTQDWCKFLPWAQWRFIRHSMYGIDGSHFWTEPKTKPRDWRAGLDARESCPSLAFEFNDFDGERIVATTIIEEREWKFGEGWFKWLSLFRSSKVSRSLGITFSSETGRRKGSWKGGTVGHSIEMLPGELHEAAFRRYCAENNMAFVGVAPC